LLNVEPDISNSSIQQSLEPTTHALLALLLASNAKARLPTAPPVTGPTPSLPTTTPVSPAIVLLDFTKTLRLTHAQPVKTSVQPAIIRLNV